jgi:CYTH domain-containing protein
MIEREWKWDIDPAAKGVIIQYGYSPRKIWQVYIHPEQDIRVRHTEDEFRDITELTVKIGDGEIREETTSLLLDVRVAQKLCATFPTIFKTRYLFEGFEIDIYHNPELNGMVTMEYEMSKNEVTPPQYPEWIRGFVRANITNDSDYKNRRLAKFCKPVPFV